MTQRHDAAIAKIARRVPKDRTPRYVVGVFVALPVLVLSIAWLDQPLGPAQTVSGVVAQVREGPVSKLLPGRTTVAVVQLADGSSVTCASLPPGIGVGSTVVIQRQSSRLLGRQLGEC